MKSYEGHVQFEAISVRVKARNAREAKKKIREKVARMKLVRLIDRKNLYIDCVE